MEGLHLQQREGHLKRKFNIDLDQYEEMLIAQGGVCAICKQPETVTYRLRIRKLAIDHNHVTGRVRGLLCVNCNTVLGHAEESIDILKRVIQYLEEHQDDR